MSKIYKVVEVDTLPAVEDAEVDTYYLVERENSTTRTMYYLHKIGDRLEWAEVGRHRWILVDNVIASGNAMPDPLDVSGVYEEADEFLVLVTFNSASSYRNTMQLIIPVDDYTSMGSVKEYMLGYYYSSSYNGSVYVCFDPNAKNIYIDSRFTKITGNQTNTRFEVTVFYR